MRLGLYLGSRHFFPPQNPAKDSHVRYRFASSPLSIEEVDFLSHLRRFH